MQEIRFATINVCNLALPGIRFYEDEEPYTPTEYEAKITWLARQLDRLDADVIGFQEIFSQQALKDVLAKTRKYQQAQHIGFDPNPQAGRLTPSVAMISRLPVIETTNHTDLPRNLEIHVPGVTLPLTRFTRAILHAQVALSAQTLIHVFICHLKSKRPDYRHDAAGNNADQLGMAVLRSLIRRSTDALGLRYLVTDHMHINRLPGVVMGDFNDVAAAVSTQLVMGVGNAHHSHNTIDERLFDSYRLQSLYDPLHDTGYSHVHEGRHETVDHILLSAAFKPDSGNAIGEVREVVYLTDHIALNPREATDHGLVMARIELMTPKTDSNKSHT
jgi:endonuclease/exonuclease/phosphatase family metal-dependent hydrolase